MFFLFSFVPNMFPSNFQMGSHQVPNVFPNGAIDLISYVLPKVLPFSPI